MARWVILDSVQIWRCSSHRGRSDRRFHWTTPKAMSLLRDLKPYQPVQPLYYAVFPAIRKSREMADGKREERIEPFLPWEAVWTAMICPIRNATSRGCYRIFFWPDSLGPSSQTSVIQSKSWQGRVAPTDLQPFLTQSDNIYLMRNIIQRPRPPISSDANLPEIPCRPDRQV